MKSTNTNRKGRYSVVVFDAPGRYRAVAVRSEVADDAGIFHACLKATVAKRHSHRR